MRHSKPSLEVTWVTQLWVNIVLSFLLEISEVNFYLAFLSLVWCKQKKEITILKF